MKRFISYYFLMFFSWSSVFTLVTVYFNEEVGLSLSTIGLVMSILPLISLFFQPVWGGLSDFSGRRKTVLIILLISNAVIAVAITWLTKSYLVIGLYLMYQVFLCGQGPLSDGMAIQFVNTHPGKSFGFIRLWGSVGYASGAFIVAAVANVMGLKWIFYVAAIGFVLAAIQMAQVQSKQEKIHKVTFMNDLNTLLKDKGYLFVLIYSFFLVGSFFGADQYLSLFIRHQGISVTILGTLTFVSVCVEVPFMLNSKKLISRFGAMKMLIFMNCIAIIRMVLLGFSTSLIHFVFAGILRGVIVGIFIPLLVELICEVTPRAVVTSAVALYSAISSGVANFMFTLLGGFIADWVGYDNLFWSYAAVMMIPLILVIKFGKIHKTQASQE